MVKGRKIGSTVANLHRPDLRAMGLGGGEYGFQIDFKPMLTTDNYNHAMIVAAWPDGTVHDIDTGNAEVRFGGAELLEQTAAVTHPSIRKLLKYGPVYAESSLLMPPVGNANALIETADLTNANFQTYMAELRMSHEQLRAVLARDTAPVPHLNNREGYGPGHDLVYWLSGYSDYYRIQELAGRFAVSGGRYLDFGGSTGRVFRNFALQTDKWDVWSCDFKESSYAFNAQYFPTEVRSFLNTAYPALPIPDGYFSLISACSVFTHINETETSWLLELRRTLRIGGIACISIHNDDTWLQMEGELRGTVENFRPDVTDSKTIPLGRTVVTFRDDDPYNCNVFHTNDFIRSHWGRFFEICAIESSFLGIQAMVVCRRVE